MGTMSGVSLVTRAGRTSRRFVMPVHLFVRSLVYLYFRGGTITPHAQHHAQHHSTRWITNMCVDVCRHGHGRGGQEDKMLQLLVRQHGAKKWSYIASFLPGRKSKQCRERWHNQVRSCQVSRRR